METPKRGRGRAKKLAIAFYCWSKGYFEKQSRDRLSDIPAATKESEKEAVPVVYNEERGEWGIRIDRRTLPEYETADFWEAVKMWNDWKEFGFPESGGTNDQGALWLSIIRLFQSCAKKLEPAR